MFKSNDCLPCGEQTIGMGRPDNIAEAERTDRVIIEWCCSSDTMLGQASTYSKGCRVIRHTIDDDLRTLGGLKVASDIGESCPIGRTLLWSAMPFAGGSPWWRLNIAQGEGVAKIRTHWADFRALWLNFDVVAQAVIAIKGVVAIEWPASFTCWKVDEVAPFLERHEFDSSIFHDCACGLVSRFNAPLGTPIKKPWRCFSNSPVMLTYLNQRCRGNHSHNECQGRDCKM
jgi:hypothetical protein